MKLSIGDVSLASHICCTLTASPHSSNFPHLVVQLPALSRRRAFSQEQTAGIVFQIKRLVFSLLSPAKVA